MADKVTSATIKAAIRARYAAPAYQTCFEVGSSTGARAQTYADAVAMGLWPSNGHEILGFEVKVTRSDWLTERAKPQKAWPIMRFCHRWYLVCPSGLVAPDELPETWGMLTYVGDKLREARKAPRLTPETPDPGFMAAMLRRASGGDAAVIAAAVERERIAMHKASEERIERELGRRQRHAITQAEEAVATFARLKEACGADFMRHFDEKEFGRAVAFVLKSGIAGSYGGVRSVLNTIRSTEQRLSELLDAAPPES